LFQGEFCIFELFLALLCHFAWLAVILPICWLLRFFLLLDDILELLLAFLSSSYASWGFYSNFKLCAFVVNGLIGRGRVKKLTGQFLGLFVMSH
jgi:hypothetical protein